METQEIIAIVGQDYADFELTINEKPELLKAIDENKRYLLHWAALLGREQHVQLLLNSNNVGIHELDDTQATPLILAALKGNVNIVKMLIEKGSNMNHQNWQGHSALQYACSKGWQDVVRYLLEKGADINIKDNRGDTSMHRLASQGRVELLRILLEHSVKPLMNLQNNEGNTPLHIACEDNETPCALLLAEHGASLEIQNKDKMTPIHLCKINLKRSILEKVNMK